MGRQSRTAATGPWLSSTWPIPASNCPICARDEAWLDRGRNADPPGWHRADGCDLDPRRGLRPWRRPRGADSGVDHRVRAGEHLLQLVAAQGAEHGAGERPCDLWRHDDLETPGPEGPPVVRARGIHRGRDAELRGLVLGQRGGDDLAACFFTEYGPADEGHADRLCRDHRRLRRHPNSAGGFIAQEPANAAAISKRKHVRVRPTQSGRRELRQPRARAGELFDAWSDRDEPPTAN